MRRFVLPPVLVLVAVLAFLVGMGLGDALTRAFGVPAPALPEGVTTEALMPWMMLAVVVLAAVLAPVAAGLRGRRLTRFAVLWLLVYGATFVNNVLEARIFMTTGAASGSGALFTLLVYLPPSLGLAAALTFLGRRVGADGAPVCPLRRLRAFARAAGSAPAPAVATAAAPVTGTGQTGGSPASLAGRLAAIWVAFPVIYLVFGLAVLPFVERWYREGLLEMAQPGWAQILPTLGLRSAVFLVVCGLVALAWGGSRRALFAALGPAVFVMVGGFHMLQAYWLPLILRGPHVLEILADSLAYVAVVAWLLGPGANAAPEAVSEQTVLG